MLAINSIEWAMEPQVSFQTNEVQGQTMTAVQENQTDDMR